jgi:hypothetical protein
LGMTMRPALSMVNWVATKALYSGSNQVKMPFRGFYADLYRCKSSTMSRNSVPGRPVCPVRPRIADLKRGAPRLGPTRCPPDQETSARTRSKVDAV